MTNSHRESSASKKMPMSHFFQQHRLHQLIHQFSLKGRRLYLILLGLAAALFVIFVGGRLPYFLLNAYILVFILPLGHVLLGWFFLKGEVTMPAAELVAGEKITFQYRVENPLLILFPRIESENKLGDRLTGNKERRKVFALQGKDWIEETVTLQCKRRGFYQTGIIKIHISDIFQLYTLEKMIAAPISLKIYPRVTTVDSFHLTARKAITGKMTKVGLKITWWKEQMCRRTFMRPGKKRL